MPFLAILALLLSACGLEHYTINAVCDPESSGTFTFSPLKTAYRPGDQVTISFTPKTGYEFLYFNGDLETTERTVKLGMVSDINITAVCEDLPVLSVTCFGRGSVSPVNGAYVSKNPGETVTLTATPEPGFEFLRWSGPDIQSTNPELTLTMDKDYSLDAHFSAPRWSFLVYMDGDNDLEEYAIEDFNELENGLFGAIQSGNTDITANLDIIVLIDRNERYSEAPTETGGSGWSDARLYQINPDNNSILFNSERLDDGTDQPGHIANIGEIDMADSSTLSWFLDYCRTNFAAEYTALVLWNHGGGAAPRIPEDGFSPEAISWDEDSGNDALFIDEVQQALADNFSAADTLDIIGFDACLMQNIENAYELRDLADYMLGSMNTIQIEGWDYRAVFSKMRFSKDESNLTPLTMGSHILTTYKEYIENNYPDNGETISLLDLDNIFELKTAVDGLGTDLARFSRREPFEQIRESTIHYYSTEHDSLKNPYYDLGHLLDNIILSGGFPEEVKERSGEARNALSAAVVLAFADDGNGQSGYFGTGSDPARGVSIFISRGNLEFDSNSHYAYHWWYTDVYTPSLYGLGYNYGQMDFCTSDSNGVVSGWREMFELWYDPDNSYTPSTY